MNGDELLALMGKWLAQGALNNVGGAIMEQQLHDLGIVRKPTEIIKEEIWNAVTFLANFMKVAIAEQYLNEIMADLTSFEQLYELFMISPETRIDTLDEMTTGTQRVSAHLESMGLQGYESYPCAVGLQLKVQDARQKYRKEPEGVKREIARKALDKMINWNRDWVDWNNSRYSTAQKTMPWNGKMKLTHFFYFEGRPMPFVFSTRQGRDVHLEKLMKGELEPLIDNEMKPNLETLKTWHQIGYPTDSVPSSEDFLPSLDDVVIPEPPPVKIKIGPLPKIFGI